MTRTNRHPSHVLSLLLSIACLAANAMADGIHYIPASDKRFLYEGRFDLSDTKAPVVIWQASRISLDFAGDSIRLLFDNAKGQNFLNAQIDGSNSIVEIPEGDRPRPVVLSGLGDRRHHLTLFKRSEANAGTVRFSGAELVGGAEAWAPKPPAYKLRMEFIGDSITAGACNEDGEADQWNNFRTHNAALSYAALTAADFSADHLNISVSGMGIITGWVPQKAGEVWDRLYPDASSARASLTNWMPQVVLVNLGENDDSYPKAHGQSFPTNFTEGYVALIQAVRKANPGTPIVLMLGGMSGGGGSKPLRQAWDSAVARLESSDKGISHFIFKHWTSLHPRTADDRIMADELTAWLKQQKFMQPYL